jgi:hypothetical protein
MKILTPLYGIPHFCGALLERLPDLESAGGCFVIPGLWKPLRDSHPYRVILVESGSMWAYRVLMNQNCLCALL